MTPRSMGTGPLWGGEKVVSSIYILISVATMVFAMGTTIAATMNLILSQEKGFICTFSHLFTFKNN